jgi:tRNA threonylcarbamoyladenosine biosynthesis protein TsaE
MEKRQRSGDTTILRIKERFEFITTSQTQTRRLGKALGKILKRGDIISLTGEIGTGKTVLVQGIAEGLGVKDRVSSCTFCLMAEYRGRIPLYHFDLYRIEKEDIGFDDFLYSDGVSVIEWADRADDIIPEEHLKIAMFHIGEKSRRLLFIPKGKHYLKIVNSLLILPRHR